MSVYNGERYIEEAIDSILNQTFEDFDFIIIDDCSTDRTVEIIQSYRDSRIRLIQNRENIGQTKSLNVGLKLAKGKYVARMDDDDISLPERLAKQVAYMEINPEIGICGTWIQTVGKVHGRIWRFPTGPDDIKCRMVFESSLAHPSVMMRRKITDKTDIYYDPLYKRAQDYELWVRASRLTALANIPEVLLCLRMHTRQQGRHNSEEREIFRGSLTLDLLSDLGILPTREEFALHRSISTWQFQGTKDFVEQAEAWLCKLKASNDKTRTYPEPAFSKVLADRWYAVCCAPGLGSWIMRKFFRSPLTAMGGLSWLRKLRFVAGHVWRRVGNV
jgi:glycosyltransferase involved in cell wall biosynthesis